jgi:anti-anti-sigma factor
MGDAVRMSVQARWGSVVVSLTGEYDTATVCGLRDVLTSAMSRGARRLVVDLAPVGFLDSASARVLVAVQQGLMARGATMALAAPRPAVARVLSLTGADQRIPVYPTVAEAEAAGSEEWLHHLVLWLPSGSGT